MRQSWETMTSASAGHIIPTPTQPVGSGWPQRDSNPGPPQQESRALPTELPRPPKKKRRKRRRRRRRTRRTRRTRRARRTRRTRSCLHGVQHPVVSYVGLSIAAEHAQVFPHVLILLNRFVVRLDKSGWLRRINDVP